MKDVLFMSGLFCIHTERYAKRYDPAAGQLPIRATFRAIFGASVSFK